MLFSSLPAILLATFPLLQSVGNGLDCTFDTRCVSGICGETDPAPLRVLMVRTPGSSSPATFILGDDRLVDGREIAEKDLPSMTRVFGEFTYKPKSLVYATGFFNAYDPAVGTVGVSFGGRQLTVETDGTAQLESLKEGRPGVSWLTRATGQCSARTF